MARSDPAVQGRVFISYRRNDSAGYAGRLYDRLADRLGYDRVFMDVDSIEPGVDFGEVIQAAVASCQVLVALIGPGWLATDQEGHKRLDDPDDIVRLELEAALSRNIRVIPVLIAGASMPSRQDLPTAVAPLAQRHAFRLSHESFRSDSDHLLHVVEQVARQER
jgi:TIR domain-containing protein